MGVAVAGLVVAVVALLVSLGFNYLQYTWRQHENQQGERERAAAEAEKKRRDAEQRRKERTPPEVYNVGGAPKPIRITGSQHSVKGPFTDLWGGITVVNPTSTHMKISPLRLIINGEEWPYQRVSFHLKSNDLERYDQISMMGNEKQDYNLHFLFPDAKTPKGTAGELWLTSSNRDDEPFPVPVNFA